MRWNMIIPTEGQALPQELLHDAAIAAADAHVVLLLLLALVVLIRNTAGSGMRFC